jgi:Raf kinase inhibitor-like YbhB/YbcL family protein
VSHNPYSLAFPAPAFTLTSNDFADGGPLPVQSYGGPDGAQQSPALTWSGVPAGTKSFVITAYDADAPIPGGLWHWIVKDVPATLAGLDQGDFSPEGSTVLANDLGFAGFAGANPPPGTGTHRMFICVTALDVETLELPEHASSALLNISMIAHTLGRAVITATSTAA